MQHSKVCQRVEETLKESESHARALVDAIPDMMFRISREGIYIDYKADIKDLVYQGHSIIGKRNRDITPPEFADLIQEKTNLTLQTSKPAGKVPKVSPVQAWAW